MDPSREPDQPYLTSDLNLASFLRCRGFTIKEIRRQSAKTTFAFAESDQLHKAILDFANDGAVGVRSFCNTFRDLKAIVR